MDNFIREFQHRYNDIKLDIQNLDSRDGSAMASLYDITQYPAILALRDDGSTLNIWQGDTLPLMDEIAGYAYS